MNTEEEEIDSTEHYKIVLIGEAGVGKTSIISQFIEQIFQEDLQASTGGTFSSKSLILDNGKTIKLDIWDTAGQEKYRSLTNLFYKDSNAAILVYDICRVESFEEIKNYWVKQIKESSVSNIILAIVANKCDLINKEKVDEEEARKFASEISAMYFRTSAKESIGIDDLFFEIAKKCIGKEDVIIKKDESREDTINKMQNDDEALDKNGTMRISMEKSFNKNNTKKKCC